MEKRNPNDDLWALMNGLQLDTDRHIFNRFSLSLSLSLFFAFGNLYVRRLFLRHVFIRELDKVSGLNWKDVFDAAVKYVSIWN